MSRACAAVLVAALFLAPAPAPAQSVPDARALGVRLEGEPGPNNAITDVLGVEVGHVTIIEGNGRLIVGEGPVRTGVTAILPRGQNAGDSTFAPPAKAHTQLERSLGGLALEHHDPAATVEVEVEAHQAAGAVDADLGVGPGGRQRAATEGQHSVVLEPGHVGLRRVCPPARLVLDAEARHGDAGPGDEQPIVDGQEVRLVDAVLLWSLRAAFPLHLSECQRARPLWRGHRECA